MKAKLIISLLLFLLLFLFYAVTAAPEVTFHDSGELITAGYTLGLTHPPGSPTWAISAYLFTKIPVGSPAYRVNLMSGFYAALTCLFVYLLVFKFIKSFDKKLPDLWVHVVGVLSALILAQTPAFWEKAVQAELYTMNSFFLAVILYLFFGWLQAERKGRSNHRLLLFIAVLLGLGAGNYLALLYFVPVIGLGVLFAKPSIIKDYKLILKGVLFFFLGFSIYLYLPIRSMADPGFDWGNPETFSNFLSVMRRERWGSLSFAPLTKDFILVWLETYQFAVQLGAITIILALIGVFAAVKKSAIFTIVVVGCFYIYAIIMMLMQAATEVLTRKLVYVSGYGMQEFHIPLYLIMVFFAGIGLYSVIDLLVKRGILKSKWAIGVVVLFIIFASSVCVVPAWPNSFRNYRHPYAFGEKVLEHVPDGGWVVPEGDNAFFILSYLKLCKGERRDVSIITPSKHFMTKIEEVLVHPNIEIKSSFIVDLIRGDQETFIEPILNQGNIFKTSDPKVVFVHLPRSSSWASHLHPDGLVFRLDDKETRRDKDRQLRFWKNLLSQKWFKLELDSKDDFRVNMATVLHDHAWWHRFNGEYDIALYLYEQAIDYSPQMRPDILTGLADCFMELNKFDDSQRICLKVLEVDKRNKKALNILGITYARQRKYNLAAECFELILEFHPDDTVARQNLESAQRDLGQGERK